MLQPDAESYLANHKSEKMRSLAPLVSPLRGYILEYLRDSGVDDPKIVKTAP